MRILTGLIAGSLMAGAAVSASANVVVLNFEGINATYPSSNWAEILDFYNGGTSNQGTSGVNYGVSFESNALALCLNTPGNNCSNTSRGGLAPGSDKGALFFLSGASTTLNYAAGFSTGFSFNYSMISPNNGSVSVYDDLNGAGNLLGTFNLAVTPSGCPGFSGAYCPFVPIGVSFAGTAKSIVFSGVANYVVFDDITFGSATPGIPEPATWGMMLMGFGLVGAAARSRRRGRVVFD